MNRLKKIFAYVLGFFLVADVASDIYDRTQGKNSGTLPESAAFPTPPLKKKDSTSLGVIFLGILIVIGLVLFFVMH